MDEILDPTISTVREHIKYAPRPKDLRGLRIGLIDNTRKNSDAVLTKLAERLRSAYGMSVERVVRKHQRAPLSDAQLAELRGCTDFVVAGVGD